MCLLCLAMQTNKIRNNLLSFVHKGFWADMPKHAEALILYTQKLTCQHSIVGSVVEF